MKLRPGVFVMCCVLAANDVVHADLLAQALDDPGPRTATSGLADRSSGAEQCLAVSLSAATKWIAAPADALAAMANDELARLLPAASAARLLDSVVVRERAATFAGRPGTRHLRPGPVTGVRGLYVAGAWTDTGWPATMEGAVRSGVAAAEAVVGRRHIAVVPHSEEVLA